MKKIIMMAAAAVIALSASAQTPKFAHVNFAELVQLAPEADTARATIESAQKEAEETFQGMYEEYNTKLQQYQQKASTWTASIKETKERELTEIQNRLREFQNSISQELEQQQAALMGPIQQKVVETVNTIAKAAGYVFVFDATQYVYVDPSQSVDITPEARKALNIPEGRTIESLQAELQAKAQAQQAQ